MPFKIFLSHAKKDLQVAKVIADKVNSMFEGDVLVYLFVDQIRGGRSWKVELKRYLDSCDAVFSLITPNSINNKWIYVEWSPFWMNDKQFFILLSDGIKSESLINPMQENQSIFLNKRDSVRFLLSEIAKLANSNSIAMYEKLEEFIIEIEQAFDRQTEEDFAIFRNPDKMLPATDSERFEIAQYFYEKGELETFVRIAKRINNDEKILDFIYIMLRDTRLDASTDLTLILELAKNMNRASHIGAIVYELIDLGNIDAEETFRVIDLIGERDKDVLSDIARKLILRNLYESKMYHYIIEEKLTSNAHRRSLAVFMLKNGLEKTSQFNSIVESIKNTAELKNLAIEIIQQSFYDKNEFIMVLDLMVRLGGTHLSTVFDNLYEKDRDYTMTLLANMKEKHTLKLLHDIDYGKK